MEQVLSSTPVTYPFVAQLIYRILCEGISEEQYEEQWRLLFAPDEGAALEAARGLGSLEEAAFADRRGRIVRWQLVAVKDLQRVSLQHGSLLGSIVREVVPVAAPLWQQ